MRWVTKIIYDSDKKIGKTDLPINTPPAYYHYYYYYYYYNYNQCYMMICWWSIDQKINFFNFLVAIVTHYNSKLCSFNPTSICYFSCQFSNSFDAHERKIFICIIFLFFFFLFGEGEGAICITCKMTISWILNLACSIYCPINTGIIMFFFLKNIPRNIRE